MGSSQTKLSSKNIRQNHVFDKEIDDPRFGHIQIYKNSANLQYIMMKEKICRSLEEHKSLISKFKDRPNFQHDNLIQLLDFEQITDDFVCGNMNKLIIYFEFHFHDLYKEIVARRRDDHYFSEEELWYLIDSLVSVLAYFQKHKLFHGDIRPSNILLTKKGVLKIADMSLFSDDTSIYYKLFSHSYVDNHYISPQLMDSLRKNILAPQYDVYKNDVFAMGMTILEAATLEYSSFCYDYESFFIHSAKIKDRLENLKIRYSPFLVNFLSDILEEKEKNRPNFEDISLLLLPFRKKDAEFRSNAVENNKTISKFSYNNENEKTAKPKPIAEPSKSNMQNNKENTTQTIFGNNSKLQPKITILDSEFPTVNNEKNWQMQLMSNLKKETNKKELPLSIKDTNVVKKQHKQEVYSDYDATFNKKNEETIDFKRMTQKMQIEANENENIVAVWQEENKKLDEIEKKINEALRLSEETIKMHEIKTASIAAVSNKSKMNMKI